MVTFSPISTWLFIPIIAIYASELRIACNILPSQVVYVLSRPKDLLNSC